MHSSPKTSDKARELERVFRYEVSKRPGGFLHGWHDLYEEYKKYRFSSLRPYFRGTSVLEIGPAEGDMTERLLDVFDRVTVLEGSKSFADKLIRKFNKEQLKIHINNELLENFRLHEKFDTIVLSHVLEHLDSPKQVLRKLESLLSTDGVLLVMTPNAKSLHRLAGVSLGMLKNIHSLNAVDKKIGHKQVYDFQRLERLVRSAGFKVSHRGGILLKPVSNVQMKKYFTPELIDTLFKLGSQFPDIACEIFVACKHARER
jgi:2-polyprenyl-3-methyl-5-hydroxy-6-metoxy-1,4-benzoquinol methylase